MSMPERRSILIRDEVESVKRHLKSGVVPESLKPVGIVETNDGRTYFSDLLLGSTQDRFSITLEGPEGDEFLALHAKSATLRQNYPVDRIYPHGLRRVALHEDDMRVGLFGYLLNSHQGASDALEFEMTQQPELEDENRYKQFIEVKVNSNQFGRSAQLLVLYPTLHQKRVRDESQFVAISYDYRILPSALVFVPMPDRILSKFS